VQVACHPLRFTLPARLKGCSARPERPNFQEFAFGEIFPIDILCTQDTLVDASAATAARGGFGIVLWQFKLQSRPPEGRRSMRAFAFDVTHPTLVTIAPDPCHFLPKK
jgi:hypothetical protein